MKMLMLFALAALIVAGSPLVLWLAFTNVPLAVLALVALAVLAVGGIVLVVRNTQRHDLGDAPARGRAPSRVAS
jgi:membrane protein implicated in regulation of membrane protease activity